MGMKAALAFPGFSGPQRRKTHQAFRRFLTTHSSVCSMEGSMGRSFYGKTNTKRMKSNNFQMSFYCFAAHFTLPHEWRSYLEARRAVFHLLPPALHKQETWTSWAQMEECLHTHCPRMFLHVFGFHFEIKHEAWEVLGSSWMVISLKDL